MAPLVSSLCQICCDKYYRTIEGLETLIEKEWIALGHPFGCRLFNTPIESPQSITDSMSETTPTFLLFLDCLAQLLRLNPGQFEYSQYYLITLWDLAISGLTSAFSSNCIRDQLTLGKDDRPFPLNRFFSTKYAQLFFDAAFSTAQILGLLAENNITSPIIFPPECPIAVVFWEECYLRWLQPAHTLNGGAIVRDMAMRDIETELAALAGKRLGHLTIRASRHPAADQDRFSSAFPFSQPGAVDYPVRSFRKSDLIFSQQHHPPSITSRSLFAAPVHEVPEPYLEDGATLIEESQEARYQRLRSRPLPAVPMVRPIDANLFPPLDASPPRNNSVWGTLV